MFRSLRSLRSAPHRSRTYSRYRLLIADLLHEGQRAKNIQFSFEADITSFLASRAVSKERDDEAISITAYVAACYAEAIGETPDVQAQKTLFGRQMIVFDDVDLAFTVERKIDGEDVAWAKVVRACNRKTAAEVHAILQRLKTVDVEAGKAWMMAKRFMALPWFVRRQVWRMFRYSPFLKKQYLGTAGLTSIGMFAQGRVKLFPISPLPITLAVGSVDRSPVVTDGEFAPRDLISLTLTVDHGVLDGAPAARFIARLQAKLARPVETPLPMTGAS